MKYCSVAVTYIYSCDKTNTHEVFFQPGQELFPKDEAGNVIYADINPVDTWKVRIVSFFITAHKVALRSCVQSCQYVCSQARGSLCDHCP